MSAETNLEVARKLWDSAAKGDPEGMQLLHPDVVWRTCGAGDHAGQYNGIDEVLLYLASTTGGVTDRVSELIDILASEDGAVIYYRMEAERGPRKSEGLFFLWMRIHDGVIREVAAVPWDQAGNDAFLRLD